MNNLITRKQISYIVYLMENSMPDLFDKIPKHNKIYTDERCDYRRRILEDQLKNLTKRYGSFLISLINEGKKKEVWNFIWGLNRLNK